MDAYRELGIEPLINAAGTLTRMKGEEGVVGRRLGKVLRGDG